MLREHAMNGGTADAVGPGQLPETVSAAAVAKDGFAVQFERPAADVAADDQISSLALLCREAWEL